MKIKVKLSEKCRRDAFVETGERLPVEYVAEVDGAELSRQARSALATWRLDESPVNLAVEWPPDTSYRFDGKLVVVDAVPATTADWETVILAALMEREANRAAWEADAVQKRDEYLAAAAAYLAGDDQGKPSLAVLDTQRHHVPGHKETIEPVMRQVNDEFVRRQDAARARRAAEMQAEREAEAAAVAQREVEKAAWVAEHGSDALRRKCAAGYDCQRAYVFERVGVEHPDYIVDWKGKAEWRSRSCPSDQAFEEAERVGGTVVWLTAPPVTGDSLLDETIADRFDYEFEGEGEAIVVRGYLVKYDLVKF